MKISKENLIKALNELKQEETLKSNYNNYVYSTFVTVIEFIGNYKEDEDDQE